MNRMLYTLILICASLSLSVIGKGEMIQAKEKLPTNIKCGPNATWSLSEDGVITVEGTGVADPHGYKKSADIFIEYRGEANKIVVSEGIIELKASALYYAGHVQEIVLPNSLQKIGEACFGDLRMMEKITLPPNIKKLPSEIFINCTNLKEITFPKKLKKIEEGAFSGCKSLEKLVIPDSVEVIEKNAIKNCRNLKEVVFPKNLKKVKMSFKNCLSLRKIVNRSSKKIELNQAKGRRTWKVGGRKTTVLKAKKTAISKGIRFKITYNLRGGKATGKLPKTYLYGQKVTLPAAKKKGYQFLGWRNIPHGGLHVGEISRYSQENVKMTAFFVKFSVKELSGGKIQVKVDDNNLHWECDDGDSPFTYAFRISENEDMKDGVIYGYGVSNEKVVFSKLEVGKTYYVDFSFYFESGEGDADDQQKKRWYLKKKVTITK